MRRLIGWLWDAAVTAWTIAVLWAILLVLWAVGATEMED